MVIRIECANLSKFLLLQLTFGNICRSWWLQVARAVRFYVSVYYMAGIKKKQGCAALGTPLWIYIGLFYYYCNNN